MGTLKYIILLVFLSFNYLFAQKDIAIQINKNDSIQIKKYEGEKLYLTIYNKKNIEYNKKRKRTKRVDGIIDCDGCKNEQFTFVVKKTSKPDNIKRNISLSDFAKSRNLFFYSGYFLIGVNYYKNLGRVTK